MEQHRTAGWLGISVVEGISLQFDEQDGQGLGSFRENWTVGTPHG